MQDSHPSELISAYIDGELSPSERATVERMFAESSEFRLARDELLVLRNRLQSLPQKSLPDDFASKVSQRIAGEVPDLLNAVTSIATTSGELSADTSRVELGRPISARIPGRGKWWTVLGAAGVAAAALVIALNVGNDGDSPLAQHSKSSGDTRVTANGPNGDAEPTPPTLNSSETDMVASSTANVSRFSLIFDITITPYGQERRVFETLLGKYGIRVDEQLKIDDALEKKILKNRFLEEVAPANRPLPKVEQADALDEVQLIYVETTNPQIDALIFDLQRRVPREVLRPQYHLAIGMDDQDVFQQLHQRTEQFARASGDVSENVGFRLKFRFDLRSLPSRFAAISGGSFAPQFQLPEKKSNTEKQKSGIRVPDSTLPLTQPGDSKKDLPDVSARTGPNHRKPLLFILRNLKEPLPDSEPQTEADGGKA